MNTSRPVLVTDDNLQNLSRDVQAAIAPGGAGPHDPGMEARVARLEADVEHIKADVADIKGTLTRLATVVDRLDGFLQATLPTLATKVDLGKRPTTAAIVTIVGVIAAIAALPVWGELAIFCLWPFRQIAQTPLNSD